MNYIYVALILCMPLHAVGLRRIINFSKHHGLRVASTRKNYVDFFHDIKPESSLMLNASIPHNLKIPRVFDGERAYRPVIEKSEAFISILCNDVVYYICEAKLPDPVTKEPLKGIWIATVKGYKLLCETSSCMSLHNFELLVHDDGKIDLVYFQY